MNRKNQWILCDHLNRQLFIKNELKKKILNSLSKNNYLPLSYKFLINYFKLKSIRKSNYIQQNNRCVGSGRIWSVLKITNYSRFLFRSSSYKGNLPGFKRSSW